MTITSQVKVLWQDSADTTRYPALAGNIEVDVAVIGGGITGLTTAWHLVQAGHRVAVLEARRVGGGTTGSSTGNLYVPVGPGLATIAAKHGRETLQQVVMARRGAMDFIAARVQEHSIDCDFARVPFHLFTTAGESARDQVQNEAATLRQVGFEIAEQIPTDFPFGTAAIMTLEQQAQLDPWRYAAGLAAELVGPSCHIYEDTRVLETRDGEPCTVKTERGSVVAKHIVKATHTPVGFYAVQAAMKPRREFAMAARLSMPQAAAGIYWNLSGGDHYSIRPLRHGGENYLMVLGQSHTPGEQKDADPGKLTDFLGNHFAIAGIDYLWAAQNYQSADYLPYIGASPLEPHTHIATGFGADGLVYGTLAGLLISDAISQRENPWIEVFSPKRFTPLASAKNFAEETAITTRHFIKDYLARGDKALDEIAAGGGTVLKVDGKRLAVSRNDEGQLHAVSAVCTHLGCIVHWNGLEKSWDCPCHGSRFSPEGTVLEGPALKDLS